MKWIILIYWIDRALSRFAVKTRKILYSCTHLVLLFKVGGGNALPSDMGMKFFWKVFIKKTVHNGKDDSERYNQIDTFDRRIASRIF